MGAHAQSSHATPYIGTAPGEGSAGIASSTSAHENLYPEQVHTDSECVFVPLYLDMPLPYCMSGFLVFHTLHVPSPWSCFARVLSLLACRWGAFVCASVLRSGDTAADDLMGVGGWKERVASRRQGQVAERTTVNVMRDCIEHVPR
jgi:hypothetical protein